jgi:hypothetical protein
MKQNPWRTPFGIALLAGSGLFLVTGFVAGTTMRNRSDNSISNQTATNNVAAATPSESDLINANRENLPPVPDQVPQQTSRSDAQPTPTAAPSLARPSQSAPSSDQDDSGKAEGAANQSDVPGGL